MLSLPSESDLGSDGHGPYPDRTRTRHLSEVVWLSVDYAIVLSHVRPFVAVFAAAEAAVVVVVVAIVAAAVGGFGPGSSPYRQTGTGSCSQTDRHCCWSYCCYCCYCC